MKSKIRFFQKNDSLLIFTDQNHFFAENQNGPYGPQELFLQYAFENLGRKKGVMEGKYNFRGVGKFEIQDREPKLDFWGLF